MALHMSHRPLILASTSRYRRGLLERLGLPFTAVAPDICESARPGERGDLLARRLASAKAGAVAGRFPEAWVLGCDQLALRGDAILGKPQTADRCERQLLDCSGQRVTFLTAVSLLCAADGRAFDHVDATHVQFRELDAQRVRHYVELEQPLDCAGGFKCEGLGILLFDRIETLDPTALIGLPLIWVGRRLAEVGLDPLA